MSEFLPETPTIFKLTTPRSHSKRLRNITPESTDHEICVTPKDPLIVTPKATKKLSRNQLKSGPMVETVPTPQQIVPPTEIKIEFVAQKKELDWKSILDDKAPGIHHQLQLEWSLLCERVRELAPETEWHFLCLGTHRYSRSALIKWRNWLENFICLPDWHSPEQMEVIFTTEDNHPVFILEWKDSEVPPPFIVNLIDWRILPTSVTGHTGYKMMFTGAYVSEKAGTA